MHCKKNGVWVRCSDNGVQQGDLYECYTCGNLIVAGLAREALHSPPFTEKYIYKLSESAIL